MSNIAITEKKSKQVKQYSTLTVAGSFSDYATTDVDFTDEEVV